MGQQAFFEGLIVDEFSNPVTTNIIGGEATYIVDDNGFMRHIDAEIVDRQVLSFFMEQLEGNKDIAVEQALEMMGQDDLFTKAALDASINNVDMDEILSHGLPLQARNMMGMIGFQVVINVHGEVVELKQPILPDEE